MKSTNQRFRLALVVVGFAVIAFSSAAEENCEICRLDSSGVKVCHETADVSGWRTGRTDCREGGFPCPPGQRCYTSNSNANACSIDYPGGCPANTDCRIREPENQDF